MEREGLVRRVRNKTDRRKWNVRLTPKAQKLKADLIPLARGVVRVSVESLNSKEVQQLLWSLSEIQKNIQAATSQFEEAVFGIESD